MTCAQCGTATRELTASEHGPLCPQCAYRQHEHDERRDTFGHLTARSLGFLYEEE